MPAGQRGERVSERLKNYLLQAVGLAAIGTVADVVPLVDENRILVRHGLGSLKSQADGRRGRPDAFDQAARKGAAWSATTSGFTIGPRLNAAGRLGQAELAIELLTTEDQGRAETIAQYIDELNLQRQSLERSIARGGESRPGIRRSRLRRRRWCWPITTGIRA